MTTSIEEGKQRTPKVSKATSHVQTRLTPETYARLVQQAKDSNSTVYALIRDVLEDKFGAA